MNPDTALLETPRSTRLHIGIFGRRNIGKSSLLNAITDQYVAIVSAMPGTTTDPASKPMELPGLGPCLLTDTAGYDDPSVLGTLRVDKTAYTVDHTDLAVLVTDVELPEKDADFARSLGGCRWSWLSARRTPILLQRYQRQKTDTRKARKDSLGVQRKNRRRHCRPVGGHCQKCARRLGHATLPHCVYQRASKVF